MVAAEPDENEDPAGGADALRQRDDTDAIVAAAAPCRADWTCRDHSTNVKRWRDGQVVLRWCAGGMCDAAKQFRRVNGHLHLAGLRAALDKQFETITPARGTQEAA